MQDPSAGVQPPLDKHVHLISSHSYPTIAQVNLEQAFRHLLDAPSVVKQVAPMSWTYVNAPPDGTLWLEWLSPGQNGGRFPSDGYVWTDPEQSYRHNVNGYTIEVLMHQSGFRPSLDHMTAHARTRYHFIAKAPHVNAAAPDPSLWIVHYHHAPQQRIIPTAQVQIDQYTRHVMQERHWLERQGRIERRDFMLHDREHWPTITIPSAQQQQQQQQQQAPPQMQHPGYYAPGAMQNPAMLAQNRYGQPPFPQPVGPPSAKRQRTQGPGNLPGPPEVAGQEHSIDDEEYTALGDYFDYLTPREISLTRFQQHQSWMEEVFQSPHALHNILPVDLGLGLMGELKGLTEGILHAPALDELLDKTPSTPSTINTLQAFTNVPQEQLEEFNSRVQKHIDEGKAEMERMKAEHAAKMREWRKTYKLTQAETQLRNASWKTHTSSVFRASGEASDEHDSAQAARVEDVVDSVEQLVQLKVKPHSDATLIKKGGLQKVERQPAAAQASSVAASDNVAFQQNAAHGSNSGGGSEQQKAVPTTAEQSNTTNDAQATSTSTGVADPANSESQDNGLDLLNESMDIDAADLGFDLDGANEEDGLVDTAAVESSTGQEVKQATSTTTAQSGTSANAATAGQAADASNSNTNNNNNEQSDSAQAPGGGSMFNDANFGDFDNELSGGSGGNEVGDGLIDFGDEDGIGMDDSAFGDALHGMDS